MVHHHDLVRFAIVLAEQPFRLVFAELVASLSWGLRELGHDVHVATFPVEGVRNIVLAPHLLLASREGEAWRPPVGTIVYNFEPACSNLFTRSLLLLTAPGVEAWDYALSTTAHMRELGSAAKHVPFAFAPCLRRAELESYERDIDLVFVGSRSTRRERLLKQLADDGMRPIALFGIFGPERDWMLARARVVLNVHYWDRAPNEDLRILCAAANGLAVSSEGPPDETRKASWAQWSDYEALSERTRELVTSGQWRSQASRGQEAVLDSPNVATVLREALR